MPFDRSRTISPVIAAVVATQDMIAIAAGEGKGDLEPLSVGLEARVRALLRPAREREVPGWMAGSPATAPVTVTTITTVTATGSTGAPSAAAAVSSKPKTSVWQDRK